MKKEACPICGKKFKEGFCCEHCRRDVCEDCTLVAIPGDTAYCVDHKAQAFELNQPAVKLRLFPNTASEAMDWLDDAVAQKKAEIDDSDEMYTREDLAAHLADALSEAEARGFVAGIERARELVQEHLVNDFMDECDVIAEWVESQGV